jgi:hypothetical protein
MTNRATTTRATRALLLATTLPALAAATAFASPAPAGGTTAAAASTHTAVVSAKLTVVGNTTMNCHAGVCTIQNHGRGRMTPFGKVTFTTRITADGNSPPCGTRSQWVVRLVRTIHTAKGKLVLHEAGLQCPQPGGPRVDLVWAVDSADSTGALAGATGRGEDTAYPLRNTDAFRGTITLAS